MSFRHDFIGMSQIAEWIMFIEIRIPLNHTIERDVFACIVDTPITLTLQSSFCIYTTCQKIRLLYRFSCQPCAGNGLLNNKRMWGPKGLAAMPWDGGCLWHSYCWNGPEQWTAIVFPIYSVLYKLDPSLKEASNDLGAGWWQTFCRITLPLSLPGIIAGVQLCFTLSLGAFVTPSLLGGGRVLVLPLIIYRNIEDINWPLGTVAGMALLLLAIITVMIFDRTLKRYTEAE